MFIVLERANCLLELVLVGTEGHVVAACDGLVDELGVNYSLDVEGLSQLAETVQ